MRARHAHTASPRSGRPRPGRARRSIAIVAALIALGGVVVAIAARPKGSSANASPTTSASKARGRAGARFDVASITPAGGSGQVASDATLAVRLSSPVNTHSPTPSLSPPVPGLWRLVTPTTFEFVSSAPLVPSASETISVPGGPAGVKSATGAYLSASISSQFTVGQGSTIRLQQLLAELGYLPLSFSPAGPILSPQEEAQPQQGTFTWRWNPPPTLVSQWTPGTPNDITEGAVMSFESQHNLNTDGVAGPSVWGPLLAAASAGTVDHDPYNYVVVSEDLPETATVYSNGNVAYSAPVNTGVAAAPTALGTFPVYERYTVTTMSGTNPDGSHYDDPGIPWVSYFNGGDALHGFIRGGYGYPQSDGCVEMSVSDAAAVYPLTPIGTLVTVT